MKTQIIDIIYIKGASIQPSSVAIMSALVEELGVEIIHAETDVGNVVTLTLDGSRHIDEIEFTLNKAFNHSLLVKESQSNTLNEAYSIFREAALLMRAKNADYGDSWRLMRLSSITDQILVKINRVRTIEESVNAPQVSEGVESEYRDILNYCVFAIMRLREQKPEV